MGIRDATSFDVGGWRVTPDEDTVSRDGRLERLEPLAMQVLVYLASRAGEVVSRSDLEAAVWKGGVVSYDSVTSTVIKLRKALGDDARKPTYIATIPKRGYQLIAPVSLPADEPLPMQASAESVAPVSSDRTDRRKVATLLVVLIAVAIVIWGVLTQVTPPAESDTQQATAPSDSPPSIVVLPFENLSGDVEQEYFSDGMTEDLLTDLSQIPALRVIARTSAFAYRSASPDIPAIKSSLNVSHVVLGSVRRSNGRVRITVKLIDAKSGEHLWAERYDREIKDIFALQDEVLSEIVSTLAVKLAAVDEQRIATKGTTNIEAYDLLMKGRHQETSFTRAGNAEAIRFYEKAIEADPNYAKAYARLANMYELRSRFGWSDNAEADTKRAFELVQKAMSLDASDPFAHWTLARIFSRLQPVRIKNLFDAVKSLERAIELEPNYADAHAFIGHLYIGIGKPDEALRAISSAIEFNPQYPFWYVRNRGLIHFLRGDYEAAIADLEEAAEKNSTTFIGRWWLAAAYAQAGRRDDAEWQIEEIRALGFQSTIKEVLEASIVFHPPYAERLAAGLRDAGVSD